MNNNFYVTSDTGRGRVDPEDSKTKAKKNTTAVGQNFRKILDKDKEGADSEITDLGDLSEEIKEHGTEIAAADQQVFSLFGKQKVQSPPTPIKLPATATKSKSPLNIARQKPVSSNQVGDTEETENFAAIEQTEEENLRGF